MPVRGQNNRRCAQVPLKTSCFFCAAKAGAPEKDGSRREKGGHRRRRNTGKNAAVARQTCRQAKKYAKQSAKSGACGADNING